MSGVARRPHCPQPSSISQRSASRPARTTRVPQARGGGGSFRSRPRLGEFAMSTSALCHMATPLDAAVAKDGTVSVGNPTAGAANACVSPIRLIAIAR
jgi:hypothetical protein